MSSPTTPDDLSGTAGARLSQLNGLQGQDLSAEWLRRQLVAALEAWSTEETELDIDRESRVDF